VPVAETGYLDKPGSFAEEGIAEKNGVSVALHYQSLVVMLKAKRAARIEIAAIRFRYTDAPENPSERTRHETHCAGTYADSNGGHCCG
jgi:hypothetical protein